MTITRQDARAWLHAAVLRACLFMMLMPASAARADAPATAQQIIDRYVAVTGGAGALAADSVLHVKAKLVSAGLRGTLDAWRRAPGSVMELVNIGTVRTREGFDGESAWRTDLTNHKVDPLEGKDLEYMASNGWFENEQWARPGNGGAALTAGSHAYYDGRAIVSVHVTPPLGPAQDLWFDEESGLLVRTTHHRDQYHWNEMFTGYRLIAGRQRWTVASQGDSAFGAGAFSRVVIDSVVRVSPGDAAVFSPPATARKLVTWTRAHGGLQVPFRYRRGHVWIMASVNGAAPAEFILDTGCTLTAIDAAYGRRIGLGAEGDMSVEGVGGTGQAGFVHMRTLRIADKSGASITVQDLKGTTLALGDEMTPLDWDDTAGLIGYDVLSRFAVELDFDRQVVVFRDPATFTPPADAKPLPMTLNRGVPTVEVTLNKDCTGLFMVDVGNATWMGVNSGQVEKCHLAGVARKEVQQWVGGIGGDFPESVCRLDSVRIGPFSWNEPVAGLTTHHWGAAGSHEIQGNLGTSVLERFRCTFDYAHGTLWLTPSARYRERDHFTRSGLLVVRWSGRVYVGGVVKHSPAAEAGFKVRDVVKSVNGRSVEQWTPEALMKLFDEGPAGSSVKVTIERDLTDQVMEMTLADVL